MPSPEVSPEVLALQREFEGLREQLRGDLDEFAARLRSMEAYFQQIGTLQMSEKEEEAQQKAKKEAHNLNSVIVAVSEPQLSEKTGPEPKEADADQVGTVPFAESAWTFPVLLGLTSASSLDVAFAVLLLLLNLGMQVMFAYVILGPSFMGAEFKEEIKAAQRWRDGIAHDYKYMDLAQTSLATRVCSADGALILSTVQATLVNQINSFMGLGPLDFEPSFFQPGILLCMLCILLWSLCVYKEFRNILLSVEALSSIPLSDATEYCQNHVRSLSRARFYTLLAAFLTRAVLASVLLFAGIRWLARTTSITDLMLNAVALNAILDVDEWLFAGFTPISIELAVKKLQPIEVRYSQRRSQVEAVFLFAVLLTTLLVPYLVMLQPLGETMALVKHELCGGIQNFVLAQNAETQVVTGLVTSSLGQADMSVIERAVDRHKFSDPEEDAYYISFQPGQIQFEAQKNHDMHSDQEQWTACVETDFMQPGGFLYQDPLMKRLVTPRLNTALAMLGEFGEISNCTEVRHLCDLPEARLLRMVCGATCGCTDPQSQPFHKVVRGGCTESCLKVGEQALDDVECRDLVPDRRWQTFWETYPQALSDFFGNSMSETVVYPAIQSMVAEMKLRGCPGLLEPSLQQEITSSVKWCEGFPPLFRPLSWLCPESCGCQRADGVPGHCPMSCGLQAVNAST